MSGFASPSQTVTLRLGGKGRRMHWRLSILGVQVARGKGLLTLRRAVWDAGKDMAERVQYGKASHDEKVAANELVALHAKIVAGKLTPPR